jgi:hypothetical protein
MFKLFAVGGAVLSRRGTGDRAPHLRETMALWLSFPVQGLDRRAE